MSDGLSATERRILKQLNRNERAPYILPELVKAIRRLLVHLPELWGDKVKNGQLQITVDEDDLDEVLRLVRNAQR